MHLATTPDEQKRWLAAWRGAVAPLAAQKEAELRALTSAEALRDSNLLLNLAPDGFRTASRTQTSGLVEQQRLFARCH